MTPNPKSGKKPKSKSPWRNFNPGWLARGDDTKLVERIAPLNTRMLKR